MELYEIFCGAAVGTQTYVTESDAIKACEARHALDGRNWDYRLILVDTEGLS